MDHTKTVEGELDRLAEDLTLGVLTRARIRSAAYECLARCAVCAGEDDWVAGLRVAATELNRLAADPQLHPVTRAVWVAGLRVAATELNRLAADPQLHPVTRAVLWRELQRVVDDLTACGHPVEL